MRALETRTLLPFSAGADIGHGGLACLHGTDFADRFHFWRGASDRRYAVSVSRIAAWAGWAEAAASLPDFDGFVLIAVARSGGKRWPLTIVAIERGADRRAAVVEALAAGACEWHVHLLGADRAARTAIVDDLRARHGRERHALSA